METISIGKKITTSTLGLNKPVLLELLAQNKGKETEIQTVLALVTGYKESVSKLNAQNTDIKFEGNFEATNLHTGEVQRASQAYFPSAAAAWLKAAFDSASAGGEGQRMPALAFTLTVKKDNAPNSATGYMFGCKALVDSAHADPFTDLRKSLPKPKSK